MLPIENKRLDRCEFRPNQRVMPNFRSLESRDQAARPELTGIHHVGELFISWWAKKSESVLVTKSSNFFVFMTYEFKICVFVCSQFVHLGVFNLRGSLCILLLPTKKTANFEKCLSYPE